MQDDLARVRPTDLHSSPMTSAKPSTTDMSPTVGACPVRADSAPSAAAAIPASSGNAVTAPADSLMPARAVGSMWSRASDSWSTGMPRRVASDSSCTRSMERAVAAGVTDAERTVRRTDAPPCARSPHRGLVPALAVGVAAGHT